MGFYLLRGRVTRARVGLWSIVGLVHVRRGQCEALPAAGESYSGPSWSMVHVGSGPC